MGLEEMARKPLNHPNATCPELVEKIVGMKLLHQKMGPKKIIASLQQAIHPGTLACRQHGWRDTEKAGAGSTPKEKAPGNALC